jgi:restriction endonuclease Mrr
LDKEIEDTTQAALFRHPLQVVQHREIHKAGIQGPIAAHTNAVNRVAIIEANQQGEAPVPLVVHDLLEKATEAVGNHEGQDLPMALLEARVEVLAGHDLRVQAFLSQNHHSALRASRCQQQPDARQQRVREIKKKNTKLAADVCRRTKKVAVLAAKQAEVAMSFLMKNSISETKKREHLKRV